MEEGKEIKEVKEKKTIRSFELSNLQNKRFCEKCSDMGIDEEECLQLLVKKFLNGEVKFKAKGWE